MSSSMKPESVTGPIAAWDRFLFTPADPRPLGLVRIATGLLLMWGLGTLALDLRAFLGSDGWVDPAILSDIRARDGRWEWSLWNLVPDSALWPAWGLAMVVLGLFTAGFATRVTAVLAWMIVVSTSRRNPQILFGFDGIVSLWTFALAVSGASGQAFSIDRWRARDRDDPPRPTVSANLGLRLIQLHLAIIYGAAGIAKLRGLSWSNGSALIVILGNAEFRPFDLTAILKVPGAVYWLNAATHAALWTELLYPVLIWNRALRPYVIGAAVAMHVGIALTLGLTEFSLAMIAGNLAFVSGERVAMWGRAWHGPRKSSAIASEGGGRSPAPALSPSRRIQR